MASQSYRRHSSHHGRTLNILSMDFTFHPSRPSETGQDPDSTDTSLPVPPPRSLSLSHDFKQFSDRSSRPRGLSLDDSAPSPPYLRSANETSQSARGRRLSTGGRRHSTAAERRSVSGRRSLGFHSLVTTKAKFVATIEGKPENDEIRSAQRQDPDLSSEPVFDEKHAEKHGAAEKNTSASPGSIREPLDKGKCKIEDPEKTGYRSPSPTRSVVNTLNRRSVEIYDEKHTEIQRISSIPSPHVDDSVATSPKVLGIVDEEEAQQTTKQSFWQRWRQRYIEIYAPENPPELILPTGPTDEEKYSYLKTNRLGLYSFGVLSFLSLSVGMWLFVVCAVPFYWFGALVVLLQAYLVVSYTVSIVGKDYDFKTHQKNLEENPILPETCPTVDVYLPCCKEPIEVLENTYKHVQKLIYPEGKLKVYVLDDGASDEVKALAASYGFTYILREDRPRLKKAGNLRWAFARTSGDFFNIYDADFCPRPDFLMEVIPQHLAYPDTAIIQTPQFFRTSDKQTWVEQGASSVQELFYRVIEVNRNRWGASICVGSNAVYRREALKDVGGTAEIGFSEDVHTGFYAMTRGWRVRYIPLCLACGICPDTPRAFFSQQMRWCMGSTTLLTNPEFWASSLNPIQKICFLSGMMYYSAISLSIFINPMPGILLIWCRPDFVKYYNLAFAIPSIFYSLIAIRMWAKASYGMHVQFIMVIQSYAYLTAIKDRLFGRALAWVPSGDTKAHKNNKYRNMRILCCSWNAFTMIMLISGIIWRVTQGLNWYECLPVIILDTFNVFLAHRFMLCSGSL